MKNYNEEVIKRLSLSINNDKNEYIDLFLKQNTSSDNYLFYLSKMFNLKLFDYKIKLDRLYPGITLGEMENCGCLLFESNNYLVCLMYDPIKYFNFDHLFIFNSKQILKYLIKEK